MCFEITSRTTKISGHMARISGHRAKISGHTSRITGHTSQISGPTSPQLPYPSRWRWPSQPNTDEQEKLASTGPGRSDLVACGIVQTKGHPMTWTVSLKTFCLPSGSWSQEDSDQIVPNGKVHDAYFVWLPCLCQTPPGRQLR